MTLMTDLPTGRSPVAEAEHITRLHAAARLLDDPAGRWMRESFARVPGAAVARHLDGVLHVLTTRGWTQRQYWDAAGAVCLMRAVSAAADLGYGDTAEAPGMPYEDTTYHAAVRHLDLMLWARTGTPVFLLSWNDAQERTAGEVLELVADAAAFARSRA